MNHSLLLAAALLAGLPPMAVRAQGGPAPARYATVLDLTAATGPSLNDASAAVWRLWGVDRAGRFQVGLGGRVSYFFADSYALDPQAGPATQQIQVVQPRLTSFNAAFHLRARIVGPVHFGFNLDALGLSTGSARSRQDLTAAGTPGPAGGAVRPVRANVLLGGLSDRGSLNSELYASVVLAGSLSLRVGYSHLVTAYEDDASRFRRFRNLAAVGLSYQLTQARLGN